MHGAAHGRLGVQEMADRLATRELAKEHCVSVHICYVLYIDCICVCEAPPFLPRPLPFNFFAFAAKSSRCDPDSGYHRGAMVTSGYSLLTWHQPWIRAEWTQN